MKTTSNILSKDFDFNAVHVGLFLSDDLWIHDKWVVTIEGENFDYSTGIGHRVAVNPLKVNKDAFNKVMNKHPRQNKANLLVYIDELKAVSKPNVLNIDDVLYSLILDAQSGSYSFDDFCDEFGYDNDSIKAFETYKACQTNAKKVKQFIKNLDEAIELFQDY